MAELKEKLKVEKAEGLRKAKDKKLNRKQTDYSSEFNPINLLGMQQDMKK